MRIDSVIQSLRVLAKADAMIAEAAFKTRLSEIALRSAALLVGIFGLIMIGVAVFFSLRDLWGVIWAATAVGLGSLAFSALLVLISHRRPRNDMQVARDMHQLAFDSLLEEARLAGNDFVNVRGLLRGPTEGTLLGIVVPLVGLLLRFLRRSASSKPTPE